MPSKELWNPRFDITTDRNGTRVHFHPPFPGAHHYKMCVTDENDGMRYCIDGMYQIKKTQNETIVIPALERNKKYNVMVRPYNSEGDYLDVWLLQRYSYTEVVSESTSSNVPDTSTTPRRPKISSPVYKQTTIQSRIFLSSQETESTKPPSTKSIPTKGATPEEMSSYYPPMNLSPPTPSVSSTPRVSARIPSKLSSHSLSTSSEKPSTSSISNKKTTPRFSRDEISSKPQTLFESTKFNSTKFQKPYTTTKQPAYKGNRGNVYHIKTEHFEWNAQSTILVLSFLFVVFMIMIYALVYRKRRKFWNRCMKGSLQDNPCCYRRRSFGNSQVTLCNPNLPVSPNPSIETIDVNEEDTADCDATDKLIIPLCVLREMPLQERTYNVLEALGD